MYVGGKGSKPLPMPTPSSYYALKLDMYRKKIFQYHSFSKF
jgi:hypothetical protein